MQTFQKMADLLEARRRGGRLYHEFLRVPAMSAGVYVLGEGEADPQKPHNEDEMYYVARGTARMQVGPEDQKVQEGDVIFVPAEVKHRFYDITEKLVVLVFFAPAETE